jgi:carbamoylphosphate synthase large subunit
MQKKTHRVLITSAGAGNAFAAVRSLRKHWKDEVFIVTCDINPKHLVSSSLFSDEFEQIPFWYDNNYKNKLYEIINKYQIDTIIPFIDNEIILIADLINEKQIANRINVQVKDENIARLCNDKLQTYKWLINNNLPAPKTSPIEAPFDKDTFILKPRFGFGSVVQTINRAEIETLTDKSGYILQEVCEKPEITVDVCYSRKFDYFNFACRERIETKSGVCTKARIFKDIEIGKISLNIAKILKLSSFCYQLMMLNDRFVITDINPRLGAGTAMSEAIGFDFFGSMFSILWGKDPSVHFLEDNLKQERFVTRQYYEFVMI